MKKKQNKGITLVALVITIIVLIILAGVSINSLINGGLITNAKDAKNIYGEGKVKEESTITKLHQRIKDEEIEQDFMLEGIPYKFKNGYLTGIENGETLLNLRKNLRKGKYDVYDCDGNLIDDTTAENTIVGTGMIIKKEIKGEYEKIGRIVIFGDFDGKEGITPSDATYLLASLTGSSWGNFGECTKIAMDVNHDEIVNYEDANYISSFLNAIEQNKYTTDIDVLEIQDQNMVKRLYKEELEEKNNQYTMTQSGSNFILNGVTNGITIGELKQDLPSNTIISKNKPKTPLEDDFEIVSGKYIVYVLTSYIGSETQEEVATFEVQ